MESCSLLSEPVSQWIYHRYCTDGRPTYSWDFLLTTGYLYLLYTGSSCTWWRKFLIQFKTAELQELLFTGVFIDSASSPIIEKKTYIKKQSLREKYPHSEFFWSIFSLRIQCECGKYGPEKLRIRTLFQIVLVIIQPTENLIFILLSTKAKKRDKTKLATKFGEIIITVISTEKSASNCWWFATWFFSLITWNVKL